MAFSTLSIADNGLLSCIEGAKKLTFRTTRARQLCGKYPSKNIVSCAELFK